MYREYTLTIRPSRDFLQELLWHGRNIIVLKPENLRQEMIGILKDMTKSYETGEWPEWGGIKESSDWEYTVCPI